MKEYFVKFRFFVFICSRVFRVKECSLNFEYQCTILNHIKNLMNEKLIYLAHFYIFILIDDISNNDSDEVGTSMSKCIKMPVVNRTLNQPVR